MTNPETTASIELHALASITAIEVEHHVTLSPNDRAIFKLGFMAGARHGLSIASAELRKTLEEA